MHYFLLNFKKFSKGVLLGLTDGARWQPQQNTYIVMFRQKALDILQKSDIKFPYFPWIMFERELFACMKYHVVYNFATVKKWVHLKRDGFNVHGNVDWQLYGYDVGKYGYDYDNGLYVSALFEVLENYALAYFIYVITSSLQQGSISILYI